MEIRLAVIEDIEIIKKYDFHISSIELKNSICLNRVYIAEKNERFVGWLRYNLFWDNIPFMNMLYVLEDYRRNGIGEKLVKYWEDNMRLLNYKMVMTSSASNEYAQHFYNKLGYNTIGGFLLEDDPFEVILSKRI